MINQIGDVNRSWIFNGLVGIVTILGFVFSVVPSGLEVQVLLLVGLFLVSVNWVVDVARKRELRQKIEKDDKIDRGRRGITVLGKKITVEMDEEGEEDEITSRFVLTPSLEDMTLNEFSAIIRAPGELTWSDLDIESDGAIYRDHERYSRDGLTEFVVMYQLEDQVQRPDTTTFEHSLKGDYMIPEKDWASTYIREPTQHAEIEVILPSGWKPEWCDSYVRDGDEGTHEPDPNIDVEVSQRSDGRWIMYWDRTGLIEQRDYVLKWQATKVDG